MRQLYSLKNMAILTLMAVAGCQSDGFLNLSANEFRKADADNPAARALCIWQPAKGRGLDDLPTRGFAGQVFFFTRGDPASVKVEGDVRIYLFDDAGPPEEQSKPIHQFDFVDGAWNAHLQMTQFGPAYQVFVPYTRDGNQKANCSLRLRLIPEEGPTVYSDMAHVTLPGVETSSESDSRGGNLTSTSNPGRATVSRTEPRPAAEPERNRQQLVRRIRQTALEQLRQGKPSRTNQQAHEVSQAMSVEPPQQVPTLFTDDASHSGSRGFRRFKLQRADAAYPGANENSRASQTGQGGQSRHPLADSPANGRTAGRNERATRRKPHPLRDADAADASGQRPESAASSRKAEGFRSYSVSLPR